MSLVYEALQKAEREKERKSGIAPAAHIPSHLTPSPSANTAVHVATTPVPAVEAPAIPGVGIRIVVGLLVVVGILATTAIGWWIWGAVNRAAANTKRPEPAAAVAPTVPAPAPATESSTPAASSPASTANDPRFKLTGIMKNPEGNYGAVINGHVV